MLTAQIDQAMDDLSDRIRRARKSAGLSLADFGKRCGLSAATIQKVENRAMAPTIPVAMKIAHGLGLHVGDLLSPPDVVPEDLILQKAGEHALLPGEDDLQCYRLSAPIKDSELEAWRMLVAPRYRAVMAVPQVTHEQIVFCEAGRIVLEMDQQRHAMSAGDTLHCLERQLYSIENPGDVAASYVIAGRFPHGPLRSWTSVR